MAEILPIRRKNLSNQSIIYEVSAAGTYILIYYDVVTSLYKVRKSLYGMVISIHEGQHEGQHHFIMSIIF